MINLPNVTLIAISSIKIERTIKALQYSCRGINFGAVKFVTHADVDPEGITIHKIPEVTNKWDFSKITVYDLPKYVDTEYCILVEWDGFIVNPEQWTDEFLNYDWTGPLWTMGHNYFDKNGNRVRVGDGISLRSKKLMSLASELNIPWLPFTNNGQHEPGYWEDSWICVKNRHIYEQHGCKFAPIELAAKWGRELHNPPIPENEGITPFVFHGRKDPYMELI
tara:strand:- start:81 stop:746 length:666 start_codon:yes stop_codon:yes gene_type:complete